MGAVRAVVTGCDTHVLTLDSTKTDDGQNYPNAG